ncbi:RNA polymerase sigma-54 factor, partial [Stenotrophomonas maltophilia]
MLQSIRLLQLEACTWNEEIQRLLDSNPLLEIEEAEAPAADATEAVAT